MFDDCFGNGALLVSERPALLDGLGCGTTVGKWKGAQALDGGSSDTSSEPQPGRRADQQGKGNRYEGDEANGVVMAVGAGMIGGE